MCFNLPVKVNGYLKTGLTHIRHLLTHIQHLALKRPKMAFLPYILPKKAISFTLLGSKNHWEVFRIFL